ncbi:MAG TPA: winged helix-turn-helix domain-containing protein [Polyangiales bacterium]|nr:winged helix-turn-helix domain-containing protein [Polyangiales bacterium]
MLHHFDVYTFDENSRELRRGAKIVKVDPQQLDLLALLLKNAGELLSRQQIIDHVWDRRELFRRSEGVPFFMVDLLGTRESSVASHDQPLDPSILALNALRERLQDLTDNSRRVLCAAAVIGHNFDIGLLSYVSSCGPEEMLDLLRGSIATKTIREATGARGNFVFDHELIREVLYNELSPYDRAQLHLRAGQGLQQRRMHDGDVTNAELAHHFLSAQPFGEVEEAIAYAQSAALDSGRVAAHAEVPDFLQRALDVLRFHVAPRADLRAALLLQLALVERVQGNPAYRTHLTTAISIAHQHRLGRLLTLAGQLLSVSPDLVTGDDAVSVLEAANEALATDDYEHRAIVLAHLAAAPPNCHSARRVDGLMSQAREYATKSSSANARAAVDDALLYFGAGPDSLGQAEEIADAVEHSGLVWRALTCHTEREQRRHGRKHQHG